MKIKFAFHLKIKVPEFIEAPKSNCLGSSVKSAQSVTAWGAMSFAGVGPLSFIKSSVDADVHQEIVEHFMLPAATRLFGDNDFSFHQDLASGHKAKTTNSCFSSREITVVDEAAHLPDLNTTENVCGTVLSRVR